TNPAYGWENITCNVTDNTDVDQVKLNLTYPDGSSSNVSMNSTSGNTYYYNTTFSQIGSYSYQVWAVDVNDNANNSVVDSFVLPPNYDINADGSVDVADLNRLGLEWGSSGDAGWIREDIDNNGMVSVGDLNLLGLHWMEDW
ncbi:MAG: hypothetical protein V5A68_07525, partial [Candidatus Thermoplasmatota archaeon]